MGTRFGISRGAHKVTAPSFNRYGVAPRDSLPRGHGARVGPGSLHVDRQRHPVNRIHQVHLV